MPDPELPPFDMDRFVERYLAGSVTAAEAGAKMQAAELGHAFSTLQIRMDAGFAFVKEVLKEAHPKAYDRVMARNGHKPPGGGDGSD